ncbi:hypothetical protein HELRODRAFT_80148, partial [Helobdella robusta]|uniref:Large ribosomal subunit protein mL38 n=1 Tax=Helobdella robusta TaxID=6412 RepID=T1G3Y2_HELRO
QVPLKEVKCDWLEELGPQHIRTIADHYNIYKDLFDGNYFYPTKELKVHYDYDDEYVTPVYWGNFVLPNEANKEPQVTFSSRPDELWAVLMTNPDENLTNQNQEYIHWLVVNIPGNDLSKGQTLVKYMPPITPMGTGYHRNVFILFKQNNVDDFKSVNRVSSDDGAKRLEQRQFSTSKFFKTHEKNLIPHSLAFFQSQWDESVRKYYRENLDMGEPVYEYNHPTAYHPPAKKYPHNEPFNVYLDRYRDKKDINEEVLRRKLSLTQSAFEPRSQAFKYPLVHRNKKYKPSWLLLKEEMMARKVDQFKDLE